MSSSTDHTDNGAGGDENPSAQDARMASRWTPLILALMIVALLLRIVAALLIDDYAQSAGRSFLVEGDANGYWELAQNIAAGRDYAIYTPPRQVMRVPGFPLLLATSITLFGDNILAARLVLAVIGTACCWLTYCLGTALHMRRTGFWAAMFVAINPLQIGSSVLILSECWFTFWMMLSLLALVRLLYRNGSQTCESAETECAEQPACAWRLSIRAAYVGALVGVTVLVRPGFLPWLAACCVGVMLLLNQGGELGRSKVADLKSGVSLFGRLLICLAIVVGCVAVMTPWAVRNLAATGHLVYTSLWSGPSLYDGLNPDATGASEMQFFEDDNLLSQMSEFEMNREYKDRAVDFATKNPGRVIALALKKAVLYLHPIPNFAKRKGWVVCGICGAIWLLLLICCFFGLHSREWDATGLLVMTGPLLLFLLVHMVFVGSVRYRLPLEFPLSVLGAIGWRRLALIKRGS